MTSALPPSRSVLQFITSYIRNIFGSRWTVNETEKSNTDPKANQDVDVISILSGESFKSAMGPRPMQYDLDESSLLERFDSCLSLSETCPCNGYYYTNVSPCILCSKDDTEHNCESKTTCDKSICESDELGDNKTEKCYQPSTHSCTCKSYYYQNVSPCSACEKLKNEGALHIISENITPKREGEVQHRTECNTKANMTYLKSNDQSEIINKVVKVEGNVQDKIKSHKRTLSSESSIINRRFTPNLNARKNRADDEKLKVKSKQNNQGEKRVYRFPKNRLKAWPSLDSMSSGESFKPLLDSENTKRNSCSSNKQEVCQDSTSHNNAVPKPRRSSKQSNIGDLDLGLSYNSCKSFWSQGRRDSHRGETTSMYFSASEEDDFVSFKDTQNSTSSLRSMSYKSAVDRIEVEERKHLFEIPKKDKGIKKENKAKRILGDLTCSLCCFCKWLHINSVVGNPTFEYTEGKVENGHRGNTYEEIYDGALCSFGIKMGQKAVRKVNRFTLNTDIDINII